MNVLATAPVRLLPKQPSVHVNPQELYNKEEKCGLNKDTGTKKPP